MKLVCRQTHFSFTEETNLVRVCVWCTCWCGLNTRCKRKKKKGKKEARENTISLRPFRRYTPRVQSFQEVGWLHLLFVGCWLNALDADCLC